MQNNIFLTDNNQKTLFGKPEEYNYSKYQNLEDFTLDDSLLKEFSDIAIKLNLSQDALEMLLDMALNMSRKQSEVSKDDIQNKLDNDIANWQKMYDEDSDLPKRNSTNLRNYMSVADNAYSELASPKLKELFSQTGLIYHPELIKMFHQIGELMQEDMISFGGKPVEEELTPAQILYGSR